jgi:hypothetical protein
MERLRRLAINDAHDMELGGGGEVDAPRLDSKPWTRADRCVGRRR